MPEIANGKSFWRFLDRNFSAVNWSSTGAGGVRCRIPAGVTEGIFCIFCIVGPSRRDRYKGTNICPDSVTGEHWKA